MNAPIPTRTRRCDGRLCSLGSVVHWPLSFDEMGWEGLIRVGVLSQKTGLRACAAATQRALRKGTSIGFVLAHRDGRWDRQAARRRTDLHKPAF
jgi:hypothetical protein